MRIMQESVRSLFTLKVFDSEEGKELKKQWGVPEEYIGVGHCVLGYRDCEYPTAKPRKDGFVIRV